MGLVRFQVSTRYSGRLRIVQVCVYDTFKEMRTAAARWSAVDEGRKDTYYNCAAVAQTFRKFSVRASGYSRQLPLAGFLRLCRKNVCGEVISHEAGHLALSIYQSDVQKTIPDKQHEETLCYLIGQITGKVVDGLYRYKVLPDSKKEVNHASPR